MSKLSSLAQKFADLLDTTPKFVDPEDIEDASAARVTQGAVHDADVTVGGVSKLRQKAAGLLSDTDQRYAGKKVSRQSLLSLDAPDDDDFGDDDYAPLVDEGPQERAPPEDSPRESEESADDMMTSPLTQPNVKAKFEAGAFKNFSRFGDDDVDSDEDVEEEEEEEDSGKGEKRGKVDMSKLFDVDVDFDDDDLSDGDSDFSDDLLNDEEDAMIEEEMAKLSAKLQQTRQARLDNLQTGDKDGATVAAAGNSFKGKTNGDDKNDAADDDDEEEDSDEEEDDDEEEDGDEEEDYDVEEEEVEDEEEEMMEDDDVTGDVDKGDNDVNEEDDVSGDDDENDASDDDEDTDGFQKFSRENVDEEVAKGEAAKSQLGLWDNFLEMRIKLQKSVVLVNQLPRPQDREVFLSQCPEDVTTGLEEVEKKMQKLLRKLVQLQSSLLAQNPDTRSIVTGTTSGPDKPKPDDDDEDIPSDSDVEEETPGDNEAVQQAIKRKISTSEYPAFLAKRHKAFQQYRNDTIQKWSDKTKVATGKVGKGFGAFDQSALKQIEQVLSDKDRLLKRTQLRRSGYAILGLREERTEAEPGRDSGDEQPREDRLPSRDSLKEYEPEIFDDDDFYHQLLRELIERKTSDVNDPVALSRHWLEIQKLRKKSKKKVDTKASKGRKIRHNLHKPLVNFMAPANFSSWSDEAITELFRSLFGRRQESKAEDGRL